VEVSVPPRNATILHVEDDPGVQNLARAALSELGGYTVLSVPDGFRAIAVAAERTPDLILLDLDLPGISGVDTLRALREIEALRPVPVVFLTAARDLLTQVELIQLGAVTVLQKPFRPRQLVRAIDRALGRNED
jgi:two-component system OmpR family response regulator